MKTPSENRSAETVIVYPAEAKSPKEERGIPGVSDAGKPGECFRCLSIIGQIEGHYVLGEGQKATRYEQIIPLLVDAEEDERVDGLLIILNTMGGDVEAGLALAELIASMSKPTVTLVLGGGHSIGVPLATAGKVSMIVPSATMTLHPVRVSGTVIGVPQSFKSMEEMQDRIIGFICKHSKAKPRRPARVDDEAGSDRQRLRNRYRRREGGGDRTHRPDRRAFGRFGRIEESRAGKTRKNLPGKERKKSFFGKEEGKSRNRY